MLARLLLTVFAFAAATAKEKEGGVTLIMRGENPVVIVGRQEFFTDYGAICLDEEGNAITHEIQYGGHIIDTSMPGIYKVHYTCRGQKETRTVVVKEGSVLSNLPGGWALGLVVVAAVAFFIISGAKSATKAQ